MKETPYWIWHILAGLILVFLLGLHMFIMHLDHIFYMFFSGSGEVLAWENVLNRSKTIGFVFIYILLLGAGLYHGLYGFRTILLELDPNSTLKKVINIGFWTIGIILFFIGSTATILVKFSSC